MKNCEKCKNPLNIAFCFGMIKGKFSKFRSEGGETMAEDMMKLVTDSEAQAREVKAQAQAKAKALTEQAQRDGEAALAQARRAAQDKVKELLAQTEAQGAEQTQATMKKYERERDALKAAASEKLARAAQQIVGKVVRG